MFSIPETPSLPQPKSDPSLRDQLRSRRDLLDRIKIESYLEACRRAPGASEGTKKKWKRALGLL